MKPRAQNSTFSTKRFTWAGCDLCRDNAAAFFRRDTETGQSYVYRQPETVEEVEIAQAALEGCPTESIGNDAGG